MSAAELPALSLCVLSVSDWRLSHTIDRSAVFFSAARQTAELHVVVDQRGLRGLMQIQGGVICKKVYHIPK